LEWEVRNTGTTTWRAGGVNGYKVRFRGAYEGELAFRVDVAPGESISFWLPDGCGWVTPGTTSTFIAEMTRDGRPFGFEFRIAVTMRGAPPTATPQVVRRPALPYYPNYSGCDWWPTGVPARGAFNNAYFELSEAWNTSASNAEINALIDRGIAGIRGMRTFNDYNQRCVDYLNSVKALLR
jgi:hypothetical protein